MDQTVRERRAEAGETGNAAKRLAMQDAAADLFMAQGYGAVSMDAIARAAGVSKATLYAHFESKENLFATIVGDACRQNTAGEEMFPEQVTDIEAALENIGLRGLNFLLQKRTLAIYRVVMAEAARFPELGEAFMANGPQRFRDRLGAWMAAQTHAGHLDAGDGQLAAEHFWALIKTQIFMRATLGLAPPPDEGHIRRTVEAAVGTFLRAFGARG